MEGIEGKLKRSIDHPGFAAHLMETVTRIRSGSQQTMIRAHELLNKIQQPATINRDKTQQHQQELNKEHNKIQNRLQNIFDSKEREPLEKRLRAIERETAHINEEISDIIQAADKSSKILRSHETTEFNDLLVEMDGLLDEASALLRGLDTTAKVKEAVKADFATKSEAFLDAASFHHTQATWMFRTMATIIIAIAAGLYGLFIRSPAHAIAQSSAPPIQIPTDQLILLVAGRVAFLVLAGWALKYVADLHRAHAEQAVIYRDRKAALGIAEAMLAASQEDEQQRELLKMLADGYLNFDQSAFRRNHTKAPKESDIDLHIKRFKDAVDAVKPILESVASTTGKVKTQQT
ncbi:hypothetical protein NVS55_33420 [Myxococcus stipitatus]|uniref:hypothetical protein n=1 Tax=Myxococcus stipitatus TaxID=83455 RepID=UPI003145165E